MKQDIAKRWVAALRSGEYQQTRQVLHSDEGYCCLGVLCDLHAKETGGAWLLTPSGHIYQQYDVLVPPRVLEWAGMRSPDGKFTDGTHWGSTLADVNDGGGTFDQIADIITQYTDEL